MISACQLSFIAKYKLSQRSNIMKFRHKY